MDKICLNDISQAMVTEMVKRILADPDTEKQFCKSVGLDPKSLLDPKLLRNIRQLFPDTPIKPLKDIFEALQLYDLVDLLEKALKVRALRPVLPLKEIEKLPNARNRPTTLYSKASVLIVDINARDSGDNAVKIESCFKCLDSRNEVTIITGKRVVEVTKILEEKMRMKEARKWKFYQLQEPLLRKKRAREMGLLPRAEIWQRNLTVDRATSESSSCETDSIQLTRLSGREFQFRKKLEEVTGSGEKWEKERSSIEMAITQKKDELQKEKEKFEMDLSTTLNKWKRNTGWLKLKLISYVIVPLWILRFSWDFREYTQICLGLRLDK